MQHVAVVLLTMVCCEVALQSTAGVKVEESQPKTKYALRSQPIGQSNVEPGQITKLLIVPDGNPVKKFDEAPDLMDFLRSVYHVSEYTIIRSLNDTMYKLHGMQNETMYRLHGMQRGTNGPALRSGPLSKAHNIHASRFLTMFASIYTVIQKANSS